MGSTRLLEGFLLLVLLVSSMRAEAAICETGSQLFRGLCFRNDNCASICEKEGFLTGKCKGVLFKCICAKDCGATGGGGGPSDGPPDSPPDDGDGGSPDGPSGDSITIIE